MATILVALILSLGSVTAFAATDLVGTWQFTGYRYQGQVNPPPNPDLVLRFQFKADGTDVLSWSRKNEPGFCERHARYEWSKGFLTEKVVWVNPDNAVECSQDPDMQMGKTTVTPARIREGIFELDLHLDTETLSYLWERVE